MDCNNFTNKILQYLDKELNTEEKISFEDHSESCANCQKIYNEVRSTYSIISIERQFDASSLFYNKLKSTLENKKEAKTIKLIPNILKPIAVAASISLGVIIGNGEQTILHTPDNDLDLVTESLSPILPTEYSVWATLNQENGSEE